MTELKKQTRKRLRGDYVRGYRIFCFFFWFCFQRKSRFNLSRKVVIVEEEVDDIYMVGIGNLEHLLEFVLIDEECVEILK